MYIIIRKWCNEYTMLPMYASVCTCVFGMQKIDCVVQCVFVELCAPCDLCLVHAHGLKLAACFFHLWPLKQPCAGCLDILRNLLGS